MRLHCSLIVSLFLSQICFSYGSSSRQPKGHSVVKRDTSNTTGVQSALLHAMLEGYDPNEWPHSDLEKPTTVSVQLYINSFGSLNAAHMDYSVDAFLRQSWNDQRLTYTGHLESMVVREQTVLDALWKPDTYFENVKQATIHDVTEPNIMFRLYRNGDVLYSIRLDMTLACKMSYRHYPHDSQVCRIRIESYAYTGDVIEYKWHENPIQVTEGVSISQFDMMDLYTLEKTFNYDTGNFSGLVVLFSLRRQSGYHILQTYLPTILIVAISWVSAWLDPNAVPGRVTLGVTTLLTLTTLAAGIREDLPPVSYVKAIDVWIGFCMIMVFGALLEFTLANWLANRKATPGVQPFKIPHWMLCLSYKGEDETGEFKTVGEQPTATRPPATYMPHAKAVDRISRVLFPGAFFIFNCVYWPYYIVNQYKDPFENY